MNKIPERQIEKCNPYFLYEKNMEIIDRGQKRMCAIIILLVILLFATNAGWIFYESQFKETEITQEVEQDAGNNGINTVIGVCGDYGETESQNND